MIEAIPNVSEGQRPEVLAALAKAVSDIADAWLLDSTADPSHNRSVFTLAGNADGLSTAIVRLFEVAIAHIDLRQHRGQHPRVGAVDVVPFIPLNGSTMDECVNLSRNIGRTIAKRFGVPVYLYEEAATRRHTRRLEHIRRGQFEHLAERMSLEEWRPDFGPSSPHPTAGASVVGARRPLVAFNVNLSTPRLDVARDIARTVRESGGGLPAVKGLGLFLAHKGIAQVSMNLTDYQVTSLDAAFSAVATEARARGVDVLESEIVGLIPAAALRGTSLSALKVSASAHSPILEDRLREIVGRA